MLNGRIVTSRFSNRPLYLQVRDALAERIAAGEWKPSTAIPNEGELAREFGVSPGTTRKALDLLEAQHLLTRRQGRGTFINDQASAELAVRYSAIRERDGRHVADEVKILDIAEDAVSEAEAARLRLRAHERVQRIRRVRFAGGRPYMLEQVAMPAAMFPGLAERPAPSHRIVVLAQEFGILLGKGEERIMLGTATHEAATHLGTKAAAPILVLDRVVCALDGRPAEWRLGHCDMANRHYLVQFK